jgi:hypothetical protein
MRAKQMHPITAAVLLQVLEEVMVAVGDIAADLLQLTQLAAVAALGDIAAVGIRHLVKAVLRIKAFHVIPLRVKPEAVAAVHLLLQGQLRVAAAAA